MEPVTTTTTTTTLSDEELAELRATAIGQKIPALWAFDYAAAGGGAKGWRAPVQPLSEEPVVDVNTSDWKSSVKVDGEGAVWFQHRIWCRLEAKRGRRDPLPAGWVQVGDTDEKTGARPGIFPLPDNPKKAPADKRAYYEAWNPAAVSVTLWWPLESHNTFGVVPLTHTGYSQAVSLEFVGPRVQGNRYGLAKHAFYQHGSKVFDGSTPALERPPTRFSAFREWLEREGHEGVVWWHREEGLFRKATRSHCGLKTLSRYSGGDNNHKE